MINLASKCNLLFMNCLNMAPGPLVFYLIYNFITFFSFMKGCNMVSNCFFRCHSNIPVGNFFGFFPSRTISNNPQNEFWRNIFLNGFIHYVFKSFFCYWMGFNNCNVFFDQKSSNMPNVSICFSAIVIQFFWKNKQKYSVLF